MWHAKHQSSVYFEIQCYVFNCRLCGLIWLNWNGTCHPPTTHVCSRLKWTVLLIHPTRLTTTSLTFSSTRLTATLRAHQIMQRPISLCMFVNVWQSWPRSIDVGTNSIVILLHIWKWVHRNPGAFTVGIQNMPMYHVNHWLVSHAERPNVYRLILCNQGSKLTPANPPNAGENSFWRVLKKTH